MIKYAKIINEETKLCEVGIGTNSIFYESIGMTLQDVEQSEKDGQYYLTGYAPQYTEEELAQQEAERIAMLTLTRGDVFRGIYKAKGITRDTLRAGISEAEITETFTADDKELALIDFDEALNFYRGNELLDVVGLQLGISTTQMDNFFETNDYTELTKEL